MAPRLEHRWKFFLLLPALFLIALVFHVWMRDSAEAQAEAAGRGGRASMGGLLPFRDSDNCLSRLQHHLYYKQDYFPSKYLRSKLRAYEQLHRRCSPEAQSFGKILNMSRTNPEVLQHLESSSGCQFVVWISYQGLGNRILTLVSAFLYALLTNRVLLMDRGTDMPELFCEPFPDSSLFLPADFPQDYLHALNSSASNKLGRVIDVGNGCQARTLPSVVYQHIAIDMTHLDKHFYCKREQDLLRQQVQWLLLRADVYYVPQLYFIDSFRKELQKMFPDQDTIFMYTARYLLHPSNSVWIKATRFYDSYLDQGSVIGYQIRSVDTNQAVLDSYWQQSLDCGLRKGFLPEVEDRTRKQSFRVRQLKKQSNSTVVHNVLVVSLFQQFYDKFKEFYLQSPTRDGSIVRVHFPSHEGYQQTDALEHDKKALAEIYLLAMSDVLVTSTRSTFGYVAMAFNGIKAWTIRGSFVETEVGTKDSCFRMTSSDPCFLREPIYDCDCNGNKPLPPSLAKCQDFPWGLRIFG